MPQWLDHAIRRPHKIIVSLATITGIFSIQNFFAEGKKVKGWLGMEGVGWVRLGRWAGSNLIYRLV